MSATYISHIVEQANLATANCGPVLLYGENIDTGSRIAGLARGVKVNDAGRILNVGNCELTHAGVGFGMMLDGGNAVLFAKQLDFMLLAIDQFVNTFNFLRAFQSPAALGSFTVFAIVCDQGYQGPQSSFNGAGDFASIANVPVFCLNGASDAALVVGRHFVAPGFRIVCVSQRLFGEAPLATPGEALDGGNVMRYRRGVDATIVSYNFALRDALYVADGLSAAGVESDVFHVNFVPDTDLRPLVSSCQQTKRLILMDDSKSVTKFGDRLITELMSTGINVELAVHTRRGVPNHAYGVNPDRPDPAAAFREITRSFTVGA